MVRPLLAAFALLAAATVSSQSTPLPERQRGIFVTPAQELALREIVAAAQNWTSVHLRARTGNFLEIYDPFLRIQLNGHKSGDHSYTISGYVDREYLHVTARPRFGNDPSKGFTFWGSGVSVDVHPYGRDGWSVWGSAGSSRLSLQISRSGSGHYSIWGDGAGGLSASAFADTVNVSGSVDLARLSPKSLALLGLALAVVHDSPAPRP